MPEKPRAVTLFVTCLIDSLFPEVARAVVSVLQALDVEVRVPPGQTCCGQPAFNAGYWEESRRMARHMIDVLDEGDLPVVIPSGSCGAMVAHYYTELFQDDPVYGPRAHRLASRIVEFTELVVDHLGVTDVGAACDSSVVYHPSCHALRGMHIDRQPRALLSHIRGLRVLEQANPATCCGFGGVFSVKMGDISGAMLNSRLDAFEATGADLVVGCDVSCLLHIEGGLRKRSSRMRTQHIAVLLAEGLR